MNPPLRKIISSFIDNLDVDYELLECGHTIRSPLDRNGYATSAMRRRCRLCEVNPTAGPVLVTYPPESSECANPPGPFPPTTTTTVTLPPTL